MKIRAIDQKIVDDVFGMGGGYVLDFSDRTFASFFADELNIDIDDERYAKSGTSKANRFRALLRDVDLPTCMRVLDTLWNYRKQLLEQGWRHNFASGEDGRFLELMQRLGQPSPTTSLDYLSAFASGRPALPAFDRRRVDDLRAQLLSLPTMEPHARGYAFESFLAALFNAFGLNAREAFKLRGEQIDGSFTLANETYLLEAKWHNELTGVPYVSREARAEGSLG